MKRFVIFVLPVLVAAQPAPVSVRSCIDAALAHHPIVRVAEARQAVAEARLDETAAARLPQVRLNARYSQLSHVDPTTIQLPIPGSQPITLFPSIDQQSGVRVSVSQPLFTGFRLSGAEDAARANAASSSEEAARDRADLALQVEQAYWSWVQALESVEVLQRALTQLAEHERIVQRLSDQGLATSSDVLNVQVKRSDVDVRLIEARTNSVLAMMALNNLVGNPLETVLTPAERPLDSLQARPATGMDALVAHAVEARPDLRALQYRREMGEATVTASRGGWFPQVALAAGYDYARPNQRIIPPKDRYDGTWDIGLTLQWNVWDWMTTASQSAQAQAAVRQTEAGIEQLTNSVRLEVTQYVRKVEDGRELVRAAQMGVRAAEESRRIAGEKFDRGTSSTTDVLDAEVALLQARLALTRAGAEVRLNDARLRRALGEHP
ncbi:MAG: TolC family protein [Bacteroidetes bacterium]|jgi:outer membrane protein TolC|nr:TolC family protein [Bacteroidota bacterium]